jgi:predicted nucleic acid-binding Zn ribbon protein
LGVIVRTCEGCGAPIFPGKRADARFCKPECYWRKKREDRAAKRPPRSCARPGCAAVFKPSRTDQMYCTRDCKARVHLSKATAKRVAREKEERRRRRKGRRCERCGGPIPETRQNAARFCSDRCVGGYAEVEPLEDCVWCGGAIVAERAANAIFCSDGCRDEARSASRHHLSRPDYQALIRDRRCLECDTPIAQSRSIRARFCPGRSCLQQFNIRRWSSNNPDRVNEHGRASSQRRRARLAAAVTESFRHREIFERDGWTCQLCQEPVDPKAQHPDPRSGSLDHVVPLAKGGHHTRANVQLAHLICNLRKADKLLGGLVAV